MDDLKTYLMSSLFIWDGISQLRSPSVFAQYFASIQVPLPNVAIWISAIIHLLGGMALLVGFKTRRALLYSPYYVLALALACICRSETKTT